MRMSIEGEGGKRGGLARIGGVEAAWVRGGNGVACRPAPAQLGQLRGADAGECGAPVSGVGGLQVSVEDVELPGANLGVCQGGRVRQGL